MLHTEIVIAAVHLVAKDLEIADTTLFVRGYVDPSTFSISVTNVDEQFDILPPVKADNFYLNMFYTEVDASKTEKRNINMPTDVVSSVSLKSVLAINETLTFDGTLNGIITRDLCSDIKYMCMAVEPGKQGSTFSKFGGLNDTVCISVAQLTNCDGESTSIIILIELHKLLKCIV